MRTVLLALRVACITLATVTPALAWVSIATGPDQRVNGLVVGDDGTIFAAGTIEAPSLRGTFFSHDGANGRVRWTKGDTTSAPSDASAIALAPGDALATATGYRDGMDVPRISVQRLTRAKGALVWSRSVTGSASTASATPSLAVATDGDVAATAGNLVARLDGGNGTVQWQTSFTDDHRLQVAMDAAGDVVVVGRTPSAELRVRKLAAADGSALWTRDFAVSTGFPSVAIAPNGDVVVRSDNDADGVATASTTWRLDGTDGSDVWSAAGIASSLPQLRPHISFAPNGDVLVGETDLQRLDGATGTEVWNANIRGIGGIGFLPGGDFVAAGSHAGEVGVRGYVRRIDWSNGAVLWHLRAMGFFSLSGGGFAADGIVAGGWNDVVLGQKPRRAIMKVALRLAGRRLAVRDDATVAARRKLDVQTTDARFTAPLQLSEGDPTIAGGELTITNPGTGETATFPLPAASWSLGGVSVSSAGAWRFRDSSGPCTKVEATTGKGWKASCRGDLGGLSLDEATQGNLRVSLRIGGTTTPATCVEFGGTVQKDQPGLFLAANAPAPPLASCPEGF